MRPLFVPAGSSDAVSYYRPALTLANPWYALHQALLQDGRSGSKPGRIRSFDRPQDLLTTSGKNLELQQSYGNIVSILTEILNSLILFQIATALLTIENCTVKSLLVHPLLVHDIA